MFAPFTGDAAQVRRPDYVPRCKRPFYEHYKLTPGRTHDLVILSARLEAVLVHAVDGRTQPCTGEGEACWLSHAEHGIRWQGWLFVREACKRSIRTITVTPGTIEDAPELVNPALDLRGVKIRLWRHDRRLCSWLHGKLGADFYAVDWTPEVPDMMNHLVGMWSAPPRKDLGRDCPATIRAIRERYVATGVIP